MFEDLRLIGVQGNRSSSSFAHRCHGSDSFFPSRTSLYALFVSATFLNTVVLHHLVILIRLNQ